MDPIDADQSGRLESIEEMLRLMNLGVRNALREHKRLGQSIVVWDRENQKIVEIPAEEIVVPDVDDDAPKQAERA